MEILLDSLISGCLPFRMPVYYEDSNDNVDLPQQQQSTRIHHWNWKMLLILTFFFYVLTCGVERIYQPMVRT